MGALYGYSGPPDDTLLTHMDAALRHRGGHDRLTDISLHGTIACRPRFADHERRRLGAGLVRDGDICVALAGYLLGPDDADPLAELLPRYRNEGVDAVRRLRGAFVLVIRDGTTLHLVRDGAGHRTVYYGVADGRFRFAVEPKGLTADPAFPRRVRPAAVAQYLTFSFVPGPGTMLEDVYELTPGAVVTWTPERGGAEQRFFIPEAEAERDGLDDADWLAHFRHDFAAAVQERLPAGEPVGIFLSGGIDSSVVTAEVAHRHDGPVKTYAIHFGPQYDNELTYARAVAERCGTEHEEVLVSPRDFLPRVRHMVWHLDDPIGDPITAPNFELARRVSRDVRWVFNGEGGDPCFGGPKNIPMLLHHWYGGIDRDETFRERMYLASYRRAYDDLDLLLAPEVRRAYDHDRDLVGIIRPFFTAHLPATFLGKLQAMNMRLKGAHLILPKVDRMTGAWGLTPLSPLFDERMVRMSLAMPGRLKLHGGIEKVVLKRTYADELPADIITRPKVGMRVPVHFWFQGEMKRYARQVLSKKAVQRVGIFDPARVKQLLAYDTAEGNTRHGIRLWMLLTFEIWRRIVIDREGV